MKVVGNDRGLHLKNSLKVGDGFLKKVVAFKIFKIADMLTEKGFPTTNNADSVLEFTAHCKDRLRVVFECDGNRDETTRATHLLGITRSNSDYGIIAAAQDLTIMN